MLVKIRSKYEWKNGLIKVSMYDGTAGAMKIIVWDEHVFIQQPL